MTLGKWKGKGKIGSGDGNARKAADAWQIVPLSGDRVFGLQSFSVTSFIWIEETDNMKTIFSV